MANDDDGVATTTWLLLRGWLFWTWKPLGGEMQRGMD